MMAFVPAAGFAEPHTLSGMPEDTPILVALSGGQDSVTLFLHIIAYARRTGAPVRVAHLDHGLRGEEATRDRLFCGRLAQAHGVPLSVKCVDIPAVCRETGESAEVAARRVRYQWFEELMAEFHIPLLAVAHHRSDQVETVLLHIVRGSGLRGLCGMEPVRPFGTGLLIRPLLGCGKADIEAFCRENEVEYVTDSTNSDPAIVRNRLRHQVLPVLGTVNPSFEAAVGRMTDSLRADRDYLEEQARLALSGLMHREGDRLWVSSEGMRTLHPALSRRVFLMLMETAGCRHTESRYVDALAALAVRGKTFDRLDLPDGVVARREPGGDICLFPRVGMAESAQKGTETVSAEPLPELFAGEGQRMYGNFCFWWTYDPVLASEWKEKSQSKENIYNLSMFAALNCAKIVGTPCLRLRESGDVLLRGGMHRQVRKLWSAVGMPPEWRATLPLLQDETGILWVPGAGQRDGSEPVAGGQTVWVTVCRPEAASGNKQKKDN